MRVALIYGGRSTEHLVSISSASNVYHTLVEAGHHVLPIAITVDGRWFLQGGEPSVHIDETAALHLVPGLGLVDRGRRLAFDVAYAPTHGQGGEDGDLQGLCRLCAIPLVGCDTLSSSIGMYKMVTQTLCEGANIPTVPTLLVSASDSVDQSLFGRATKRFGAHLFVKAEASGSSVGVYTVQKATLASLARAVAQARRYSERVLIQPLMAPMVEVECAVLERADSTLVVSEPGRVVDPGSPTVGFLDYHHKYAAHGGAYLALPTGLDVAVNEQIKEYARQTFVAIKARGYARVDFFVSGQAIYMNEINTAPGMTRQSHWPALMAYSGWSLKDALKELFVGALEHQRRQEQLIHSPPETP